MHVQIAREHLFSMLMYPAMDVFAIPTGVGAYFRWVLTSH